jgi:hypothetical protein
VAAEDFEEPLVGQWSVYFGFNETSKARQGEGVSPSVEGIEYGMNLPNKQSSNLDTRHASSIFSFSLFFEDSNNINNINLKIKIY